MASQRKQMWQGLDNANIMGVELLTAVLLWGGIGYGLDRWLGTSPWFFVIGVLGGNAARLYIILLRARRMDAAEDAAVPSSRPTTSPPDAGRLPARPPEGPTAGSSRRQARRDRRRSAKRAS